MRNLFIAALLAATSFTPALARDGEDLARVRGPVGERLGQHFENRMDRGGRRMESRSERPAVAQPQPQQRAEPQFSRRDGNSGGDFNRNRGDRGDRGGVVTSVPAQEWGRRNHDSNDGRRHGEGWRGGNRNGGDFDRNRDGQPDRRWDRNRNGRVDGNWDHNRDGNLDRRWDRNRDGRLDGRWDGNRDNRLDRRWDHNRDGRLDRRWDHNRDGRVDRRYRHNDRHSWDRGWRNNNRYDWHGYRSRYNDYYRLPRYSNPYGYGYGYQRFGIGIYLDSLFYSSRYWVREPYYYRLPDAPYGYRWVRYYDDVLLVDMRSGYVVDVIHNFFW